MSLLNVRAQFPQLHREIRGHRLVYLDSGATTLKPSSVNAAVSMYLGAGAANVHRGAHLLSDEATEKFEATREKVRAFLGAEQRSEIIFTKGTTESINLVARSLGALILNEGDEILLSQMEHHSNIVPWQMIAKERKAQVNFIRVTDEGELDYADFESKLSSRVKIVSLVHLSNALGTINPIAKFFKAARAVGAYTVADAAQSASLLPIDVRAIGCDFLALSAHKLFGPTGVGVLYGRQELLERMPPYQGGGSMISEVSERGSTFLAPPHRFEAGTPPIAEVIGFGAAIDFVQSLGFDKIIEHERAIMALAEEGLNQIGDIRRIGTAKESGHVLSFLVGNNHPSDVGAILDEQGVAVRSGHHCCQPLMKRFGIPGTVRASFSVYTSEEDVRDFINALAKAKDLLG